MNTEIGETSVEQSAPVRRRLDSIFRALQMNTEIGETSVEQSAPVFWRPDSIFRAPAHMRYDRKNDIEPKLVSIGPYYHGRPNLNPMEELKRECVPYLQNKQQGGRGLLATEFMEFEMDARVFYKEKFNHEPRDFVEMLVNDSCFIIRVILSVSQGVQESMAFLDVNIKEVRSDLLLLENQIPLFFIRKVYDSVFSGRLPPFETVLEPFICLDMPWRINYSAKPSKAAHLLDLYWRYSTSEPSELSEPVSEPVDIFRNGFEKVITEPLNNFRSGYLQAIYERLNNNGSLFHENVITLLINFASEFEQARNEQLNIFQLPAGFDKKTIIQQLNNFRDSFKLAVNKQLDTHRVTNEKLYNLRDGFEPMVIEQIKTFQIGFQKAINDSIQSDIEQGMNEQLRYLSSGFDQVINEQLNNFGRPGFQEQPTLAEIFRPTNAPKEIANATVLHQIAGIKFEKLNDEHDHDGLDVIFSNGIIQMPWLKIDSRLVTLFVNLIAYENSKLPNMRIFSSYIKLMDALIDSEKDVELLQQCGVISNTLSSHNMAATFFNDIGNFCLIDSKSNCFSGLYENVPEYYDSSWTRRYTILRRDYCSSPWASISVSAGVILLLLTIVQTGYTIYAYYKPPK